MCGLEGKRKGTILCLPEPKPAFDEPVEPETKPVLALPDDHDPPWLDATARHFRIENKTK